MMFTAFILYSFSLWAQVDLTQLNGKFIRCSSVPLMGIYSEHLRPNRFVCPSAQGFVINETPVKKISFKFTCFEKALPIIEVETNNTCNTVGFLQKKSSLESIAKTEKNDYFAGVSKDECVAEILTSELFEYYPIFSSPGSFSNEKFLETSDFNSEADPDYLSRINGGYTQKEIATPETAPIQDTMEIESEKLQQICGLNSLDTLEEKTQKEFLKIILLLYQNQDPQFQEEKLQRKLFCLLKNYYEKNEDLDHLFELIGSMKFDQENCTN